jgi:pimeloyl-ACP methyl ester carboxylesterase
MLTTIRFLNRYLRPAPGRTLESEVTYERETGVLPATLYRPRAGRAALPAWLVLHGLTRPGRAHPSLVRFARAVASAGNIVFVPEIPEWRALRVEPARAVATIRAAVRALQQRDDVRHDRVGLFGFSFGATQGLVAAADPATSGLLAGVAAWGGYCDLQRVFRFGLTGLHEHDGVTYQARPDPYGAWIIAGNYLTRVPGHENDEPVARALLDLAAEAGDRGPYAWDPVYDPSKARHRATLTTAQQALFDMLAPDTRAPVPDPEPLLEFADRLAGTVLEHEPLMDPRPHLPRVRVPLVFAHGRDDRLIPFSETLRLARVAPPQQTRSVTITALFQHSGGTQSGLGILGTAREAARFAALLQRVLALV